jgi:hypothetical protein
VHHSHITIRSAQVLWSISEAIQFANIRRRDPVQRCPLTLCHRTFSTAERTLPAVWPVIDKWATTTVFGAVPSRYCAARYAAYARHLATKGPKHWGAGLSIHELDMRAQSASMNLNLPAGWQTTELPSCLRGMEPAAVGRK